MKKTIITVRGNIQILLFCLVILIGFTRCKSTKETENIVAVSQPTASQPIGEITLSDIEAAVANQSALSIKPIDIRAPKYFRSITLWKEGKLATMDGWGRFAEISFKGADKMRITPLVNFPRWKTDNTLMAWPEADLFFITTSNAMSHIAYLPAEFTRSFIPLLGYEQFKPKLLDAQEGIIVFTYRPWDLITTEICYVFYNYKQDKVLNKADEYKDYQIVYDFFFNDEVLLAHTDEIKDHSRYAAFFLYDWKTGKQTETELTKKLTQLQLYPFFINKEKNLLTAYSRITRSHVKIDWDEDYKNINIISLDVHLPKDKKNSNVLLSSNGEWLFTHIGPYDGLYGESLYRQAFYHIDSRYPGGLSFPIMIDYYTDVPEFGVFFNHPVHGMCYVVECYDEKRQYLRLYKMDDMLTEINRQLLEVKE